VQNLDARSGYAHAISSFAWTQGTLQSLIGASAADLRHAKWRAGKVSCRQLFDRSGEPAHFSELFRRMCPWSRTSPRAGRKTKRGGQLRSGNEGQFAGSALARELTRLGADHIVAHGTHDATDS